MRLFTPNVKNMYKKKDIKGLVKALRHKDREVRQNAIDYLRSLQTFYRGTKVVDEIRRAQNDSDTLVALTALRTLEALGVASEVERKKAENLERKIHEDGEKALKDLERHRRTIEFFSRWDLNLACPKCGKYARVPEGSTHRPDMRALECPYCGAHYDINQARRDYEDGKSSDS